MTSRFFRRPLACLVLSLAATLAAPAQALSLSGYFPAAAQIDELDEIAVREPLQLKSADDVRESVMVRLVMSGALKMIGTGYALGADNAEEVDCSALMQRIYRGAGLDLPRTARAQQSEGTPVRLADLRKGDLLFYRWQRRNLHVALYMDGGYILHASSGAGRVVMTRLNDSWRRRLVAVRRPL
ncbi:MAG TPA: C40 family peptidase [Solimonas sp.]|nr:C40 family peptidase [Solimonas sp.]